MCGEDGEAAKAKVKDDHALFLLVAVVGRGDTSPLPIRDHHGPLSPFIAALRNNVKSLFYMY